MAQQKIWVKGIGSALAVAVLLLQSSYGLAAPVELSLEESVAMALRNNVVTKLAQADKDISAQELIGAKAGFDPA